MLSDATGNLPLARASGNIRIVVTGVTGSGKTTLAQHLAKLFCVPHIELDALYWGADWTPASLDNFRRRVLAATSCAQWVVDGNYLASRDITWTKATMLIWLDYSLPLILWRLLTRVLNRSLEREVLWNGNQESFWTHFLSRESLFLWALQTHGKIRTDYPVIFRKVRYGHLKIVRFQSSSATRRWLDRCSFVL